MTLPVTPADIAAAAARLEGVAVMTPLLTNDWLDEATGARVFIKPECLQRTGSFKIRGAYNRLAQFTKAERDAGAVAFSSGNHAQGVAAAARLLGIHATIVMPADAPAMKLANTRAYGAEVVTYDRRTESREAIARRIADARGAVLVPSYDDPHIVAGQGTVGRELAAQMREAKATPDIVLCPVGGGGLIAGNALAIRDSFPDAAIHGAEPAGFDDTARSLAAGERCGHDPDAVSVCDALLAPMPGQIPFAVMQQTLSDGLSVTDDEVATAMRFAFERLKLVVEPGGAVALAALLCGKVAAQGAIVAVVLSGGNVDAPLFAEMIARAETIR